MVKHKLSEYQNGMNLLVSEASESDRSMLDFGIIKLNEGTVWEDDSDRERALLLIRGTVTFHWEGTTREATRISCFDEPPEVLQVPEKMRVRLTGGPGGAELGYEACLNTTNFAPRYYAKTDIHKEIFGAGAWGGTSIRTVRTVFDGEKMKSSGMVLGEVINHPGKWSSYPPHDHPHPEIYHYRFLPSQGFGVSLLEDDAHLIKDGSTSLISPNKTHSQVSAPGYAMYYIWMIPHLPGNRWFPTNRYFRKEHQWLLHKDVQIWPELSKNS